MRNNAKKAFTLVELIVVITILAILWTIAFLSLQWYSADSRNSKRTSDISNIRSSMSVAQTKWVNMISFVSPVVSKQLPASSPIGWTWVSVAVDYTAWSPNYTTLWLKPSSFKDPSGKEYVLWVTTKLNWRHELASSLEKWSSKISFVSWDFTSRRTEFNNNKTTGTYSTTTFSWVTSVLLANADLNKFYVNDYVNNWVAPWVRIIWVSSDLKRLTFSSALPSSSNAYLQLWSWSTAADWVYWLTTASWTITSVITNGDSVNLPY